MEMLNRTALIVTPKRRFLEWANRLPGGGRPITLDELPSLRSVYLAATGDESPPVDDLLETYWEEIFEEWLSGWVRDESLWPVNRTPHLFRDWFHVDSIDGIYDMDPDEPVTVHELARTRCAVCDADLTDEVIAVVTFADRRVGRMTLAELETLEHPGDAAADAERPMIVFRCCSETCAEEAEKSLRSAQDEQ